MSTEVLVQVRNMVRQLSVQEKLYLLNDITTQILQVSASLPSLAPSDFPVFQGAEWPSDAPVRREDLYNDRGR